VNDVNDTLKIEANITWIGTLGNLQFFLFCMYIILRRCKRKKAGSRFSCYAERRL